MPPTASIVIGSLDDTALLQDEARAADAVVNAANSDHRGAVEALIAGLKDSGKPLLHTSGSSIVGDEAMGEPSEKVFLRRHADRAPRRQGSAGRHRPAGARCARHSLRRVVQHHDLRPFAWAAGAERGVPALLWQARASGVARYIGRGLNRWSNVHIADVAALYGLAIANAPAGTFMYVENGEESLSEIVRAIAARLDLGPAQPWAPEEAVAFWGRRTAVFSLGSNSRVRGRRAKELLGWAPRHRSITKWIAEEGV